MHCARDGVGDARRLERTCNTDLRKSVTFSQILSHLRVHLLSCNLMMYIRTVELETNLTNTYSYSYTTSLQSSTKYNSTTGTKNALWH